MKDGVTQDISIMLAQSYNGKIYRKNEKLFRENKQTTTKSKKSNNGGLGHI